MCVRLRRTRLDKMGGTDLPYIMYVRTCPCNTNTCTLSAVCTLCLSNMKYRKEVETRLGKANLESAGESD